MGISATQCMATVGERQVLEDGQLITLKTWAHRKVEPADLRRRERCIKKLRARAIKRILQARTEE